LADISSYHKTSHWLQHHKPTFTK